ncbi:tetratricopeptide repeat protein [Haliangium sp.]|uniref:tetratricopeptide repeat protein n=1 Tax=Haliangium sp. TaxID=2663208 RepID=UPI003D1103DA
MIYAAPDRLWPVLLALALLLAGALTLELAASGREAEPMVIEIHAAGAVLSDDDGPGQGDDDDSEDGVPVDQVHERARLAARRGELATALGLFRKAADAHPDAGQLHAELGYWLLVADREQEAAQALTRAETLLPDNAWVCLNLGVAQQRLGHLDQAEARYRQALERRQDYGAARVALGKVLRKRGALREAIVVLEQAAAYGSNDERARALVALGRAYLEAGHRARAAQAFEAAIERAPAAVEIRVGVARGYLTAGTDSDIARAIAVLERAAVLAPDVPGVHGALARGFEKKGDDRAAEQAYEHALRLDPGYRYARIRLFRLALDAQDFPRARMQVEYLLQHAPEVPEHSFWAGLVAARERRVDDARSYYRDAIDKAQGTYPEAYFNLGRVEKAAGHLDEAIAAYQTAIAQRPDYDAARNNLGLALKQAGRLDQAEATYREALTRAPDYAAAWLNLGQLLADQERYDEAIECFESALTARPGYPAARLDLGVAYRKAGHIDDAVATYQALVSEHPRYTSAWFNLAIALDAQAQPERARDAYLAALALDPDHVPSLRNLSQLDVRIGRLSEARATVEELLDHDPTDEEGRLVLADLRRRDGDLAGCERDARLVLARTPDHQAATALLGECTSAP